MRVLLRLVCLTSLVYLAVVCLTVQAEDSHVDVIVVRGVIDAVNSRYLIRSLDQAEADGAEALIVALDTPGGLDSSMRAMLQRMMASTVPTVVYVTPSGARAGSAGVFITLASDVAAMAPHTNIGAAHPVAAGQQLDDVMEAKVTNDAAALARTLAARRNRNESWAELAVRQSVSITEREALDLHVIDLVATDLPDLLTRLDGRVVPTAGGERVLHTLDASIRQVELTLPEQAVHTLIDPNIAYLLFTIGIWAIIAEFYHPGALIPGITGVVCLVLAFVAFDSLPMNWAGLGLIVLAMGLFAADVMTPSHGALTVGGVICFVLGSLLLFSPATPATPTLPDVRVSPLTIGGLTAGLIGFFAFALRAGLRAQRLPPSTRLGDLLGATGVARTELKPGGPGGTVFVQQEPWTAYAEREPIAPGDRIEVVGVDGLRLRVVKRT